MPLPQLLKKQPGVMVVGFAPRMQTESWWMEEEDGREATFIESSSAEGCKQTPQHTTGWEAGLCCARTAHMSLPWEDPAALPIPTIPGSV